MTVDAVIGRIAAVSGIEGVTVTGGEPFAQSDALQDLAERVHMAGLSLMVFTGYELDELNCLAASNVLAVTDIVVTGRFVLAERDLSLRWRGSRNQLVHYLSNRYTPNVENDGVDLEVIIKANGELNVTGFPEAELIESLQSP